MESSSTPLELAAAEVPVVPAVDPNAVPVVPAVDPSAVPLAEAAPIVTDFEITLADDSPIDQEGLDAIAQYASDNSLTKEQTDSVIAHQEKLINQGSASAKAVQDERLVADAATLNNDPMFSGEQRAENFASINRAVTAFGDDSLREALKDPYVGSNLGLAKFLVKIGKAMGSDTIEGVGTLPTAPADNSESAMLKTMYPGMF